MALNSLLCADVPLRTYTLTQFTSTIMHSANTSQFNAHCC